MTKGTLLKTVFFDDDDQSMSAWKMSWEAEYADGTKTKGPEFLLKSENLDALMDSITRHLGFETDLLYARKWYMTKIVEKGL